MKSYLAIIVISLMLLSCTDSNDSNELNAEYDLLKSSEPVEKVNTNELAKKANKPKYTLGEDYELLPKPYATENPKKIVIYEFFGYACPHCFYFEPFVTKWFKTKPGYVELKRVPLNFQSGWANLQQAYLTAEAMGIAELSHEKLFKAIHNQHKRFNSIDELAQWYEQEINIEAKEFLATAESFILDSKLRKADKMGFEMQVTSTPTLIINGKYRISKKIRDRDEIINIMKYLISQEAVTMGLISQ